MQRLLLLLILCVAGYMSANAQCTACVIDSLPLTPASQYPDGAFYPNPFPEITQGAYYDTSITYVMPKSYDTGIIGVVPIAKVVLLSISGLPNGITWSTNAVNNTFFPQTKQYDCIKLCGTTFSAPGNYPLTITVDGYADVNGTLISQPVSFTLDVTVVAGSAGTATFIATNFQGCDSITTSFEGLIDAAPQPTQYFWDFGNGNTSTAKIPADQNYTVGTYPVVLQTIIGAYYIDTFVINSINEDWEESVVECNDLAPIFNTPLCIADQKPDLKIEIIDLSTGTVVYSGGRITNTNPPVRWTGINTDLSGTGPFAVKIMDDDSYTGNLSPDDDLGTYGVNNLSLGRHNWGQGVNSGTYSIVFVPTLVYSDTLNVVVSASPAEPTITEAGGVSEICGGDTVTLISSNGFTYQWFKDSIAITSATDSFLNVTTSGAYVVEITSAQGCLAKSAPDTIKVLSNPPNPVIIYQSSTDQLAATNGAGYTIQWFFNGVAIPLANAVFYDNPQPGAYSVSFVNSNGCKKTSSAFAFTSVAGNMLIEDNMTSQVYPNPNRGVFNVNVAGLPLNTHVTLTMVNVLGQEVMNFEVNAVNGKLNVPVQLNSLNEGIYLMQIKAGNTNQLHKIVVSK